MPRPAVPSPALTVLTAEPGLSLSAKGLAVYLLSRPPRTITRAELFRSTADPMARIDAAIRELLAAGLVDRVPPRRRGDRTSGGIVLRQPQA
jgi:hypothetical protein